MKIYKVRTPYAAIIVAEDFAQLLSKYEEDVCELDDLKDLDAFKDSTYTLAREVCVEEVAEAFDEKSVAVIGTERAKQLVKDALYSDKPTLLVIDAVLI